jgi:hypothetical protein
MSNKELFNHHEARMRVLEVLAKNLNLTGPYHLNGDIILSSQSHPVATMSEPFHRQVSTPEGAVTSDDAALFAISYDLLQDYILLRELAIEYMAAEKAYRLAHDKHEAGPGLTLRANKADAALRAVLDIE